jgi:hypothetical protein
MIVTELGLGFGTLVQIMQMRIIYTVLLDATSSA